MSARRIMGTEVEYGISVPGDPTANPVITSTQVVLAYAAAAELPRAKRARWDYEVESPLRDARGFDLSTPSIPTSPDSDLDDLGAEMDTAELLLTPELGADIAIAQEVSASNRANAERILTALARRDGRRPRIEVPPEALDVVREIGRASCRERV